MLFALIYVATRFCDAKQTAMKKQDFRFCEVLIVVHHCCYLTVPTKTEKLYLKVEIGLELLYWKAINCTGVSNKVTSVCYKLFSLSVEDAVFFICMDFDMADKGNINYL